MIPPNRRLSLASTALTPMLTWSQIQAHYAGSWVELIDADWPWDRATPRRARVRYHAAERAELLAAISGEPAAGESTIIRVEDRRPGSYHPLVQWPTVQDNSAAL